MREKMEKNFPKLGSNCEILINPATYPVSKLDLYAYYKIFKNMRTKSSGVAKKRTQSVTYLFCFLKKRN